MNSVLRSADAAIEDRALWYGAPADNLRRIGTVWGVLLEKYVGRCAAGGKGTVPPRLVATMLAAVKLVRDIQANGRDNAVDAAGYAALMEIRNETGD